jgi:hypothetical protein
MPSPGPSELIVLVAVGLVFLLPLYVLMKRGQRRYDQLDRIERNDQLDRIERKLDDIDRRLN